MSDEITSTSESSGIERSDHTAVAVGSFIVAAAAFFVGGAITIQADPPPSTAPTLGMISHALWFIAVALVAVGVVALIREIEGLRTGLAGYLAAGTFGLAVVHGLQWVTWAYVDVRAAGHEEYDLLVDSLIAPFGAGHALTYGVLVGTGTALLGWALARSAVGTRLVGWAGVVVGAGAALAAGGSLVTVATGGGDGSLLYNVAIILLPVVYLWVVVVGVMVYRADGTIS